MKLPLSIVDDKDLQALVKRESKKRKTKEFCCCGKKAVTKEPGTREPLCERCFRLQKEMYPVGKHKIPRLKEKFFNDLTEWD